MNVADVAHVESQTLDGCTAHIQYGASTSKRSLSDPGKGPRTYDWQRVELSDPPQKGWKRWLLVRRSISDPSELTAYIAYARARTTLAEQVLLAGMRSPVEESIQCAKGEVGLDHYEVRSWIGWYRHITLAMWAQAFLSVIREETGAEVAPKAGLQNRPGMSSLARFKTRRGLRSA